ncbi:hypothetical protein VTN77DRAFT_484 [Rasamsonia byssochlamydoides]|uniref:uncharacterized protein n=1 Tax=Rasamsonia byssochlamydoides TaxID=89139 RepID=UPI0037438FD1
MEVLVAVAAWAIGTFCSTLSHSNGFASTICPRGNISVDLASKLSSGAHIYYPGSSGFAEATDRWSALDAPNVTIIVEVATENDVAETVKYANASNIPFIAVNGGHGAITSLGKVHHGIEIWLNQLNSVTISPTGDTATFGGGILTKTIHRHAVGSRQADRGGHGFLQGRHGLIADQFVSMRLVLADGSIMTVDSSSDLFWAIKGTGHNFGIVTEVTSKIYDVEDGGLWSYSSFVFTYDKVEGLYDRINTHLLQNSTQPVDVLHYSFFFNSPTIDPDHAVIAFFILREGVSAVEETYTAPFHELGPVASDAAAGTYQDLAAWTSNANESPPCQKAGLVNIRFPVNMQRYNVTTQRLAFDTFSTIAHQTPALNNSLFLFEGYAVQGVQAIPAESTAFPHREDNLIVAPLIIYAPAGPALDAEAIAFGRGLRQIIFTGSGETELHAYVNYAFGDERPQDWYGYEPWRIERLTALKEKYDPERRFNFFAPFA